MFFKTCLYIPVRSMAEWPYKFKTFTTKQYNSNIKYISVIPLYHTDLQLMLTSLILVSIIYVQKTLRNFLYSIHVSRFLGSIQIKLKPTDQSDITTSKNELQLCHSALQASKSNNIGSKNQLKINPADFPGIYI